MQESRVTREEGLDALDLRTYATPLQLNADRFTILALSDISHEKLRRALERIFFHDILNTVGGLHGFVELLQQSDPTEMQDFKSPLLQLSRELVEEIKSQRDLLAAENDDLAVAPVTVKSGSILRDVAELYRNHEVANTRFVKIVESSVDCDVITDSTLLRRVLGNMVKNGLEASSENESVTLGCDLRDDGAEFWVHNPRYIPESIQQQIFRRSFSTKGSNRGLGTYSMKLIGERYLGGRVSFSTSPDEGTVFSIWIPPTGADTQPGSSAPLNSNDPPGPPHSRN
jgi:signal transduction histidine kinase